MSDLILKPIEKLPLGLQTFASLRIGKTPFKSLSPMQKETECLDAVTKVHAMCGDKGEDDVLLEFQTIELQSCLTGKYGELTVEEINKALEMLIAGEFGQFFGLNRKSYYQALKGYYELPQRSECMKEYLSLTEAPKPLISQEESEKICLNGAIQHFHEYKEMKNKVHPMFAGIYYKSLEKAGIISYSNEEKKSMLIEAEKEYVTELQTKKMAGVIKKDAYEQILANMSGNLSLKNWARRIALYRFFDQLIKDNRSINDLIK